MEISLEELSEKKRGKGIGSMTAGELLARINADQADAKMNEKDRREALSAGRTELSRRYAYALASFAFALIGVPLAITAQRKETSVGFLLSVVVGVTYFFVSMSVYALRTNARIYPEYLIWLPNVLCLALGGLLFFRMSRR